MAEHLLKREQTSEAAEILQLLNEMTPVEQKEMLTFMQAAKFVRSLDKVSEISAQSA